ncbi:hypothetical protein FF38_09451 [Lucilia cuprina]|uniref:Uncharacterized protein n=1 Tax=Lucilia cuprina TaxID=7375 RepID=A0A0L0C8V8_LUCCU|nr:hypothetical protein FF38_09451 [Lucilia cuprina]
MNIANQKRPLPLHIPMTMHEVTLLIIWNMADLDYGLDLILQIQHLTSGVFAGSKLQRKRTNQGVKKTKKSNQIVVDVIAMMLGDSCPNSTEAHIPKYEEDAIQDSVSNTQSSINANTDAIEPKALPFIERPKHSGAARRRLKVYIEYGMETRKICLRPMKEVRTSSNTASVHEAKNANASHNRNFNHRIEMLQQSSQFFSTLSIDLSKDKTR